MSGGEAKAMVTDSGGEISMSIEETNRVRASLGLKPLDMTPKAHKEGSKDAPIDAGAARAKDEAEAEAEAMRQKIAEMKRQRLAQSKVISKKSLGEADDHDDAAAWVSRARKKQKKAVDDMAKRMAELDEQDGEGDYTSNDLKGMKVLHEADNFQEGETVILTLADSRVFKCENGQGYVNEEEDVLENVAMSEFEKTAIAKERAKTKAKYMNADDDEFTEGGKSTNLLSKYDDFEVDGQKIGTNKEDRKSMRLGDKGELDLTKEERQAAIRAKLSQAPGKVIVSLDMKIKEESDFQTAEEAAAQFRKSSKPKKLRRKVKEKFKIEAEGGGDGKKDHGSRAGRAATNQEKDAQAERKKREEGFERAKSKAADKSQVLVEEDDDDDGEIDWSKVGVGIGGSDEAIGDADEDDHELAMSLQRSREAAQNKAKSSYKPDVATLVADKVKEEEDGAGNDLTFTTTSEFCRALQGAKAHVPAAVKEEKIKAAQNHSTGVTELVKRAGEGTWNDQGGGDAEMADGDGEMEDDGKAMAMMMEEAGGVQESDGEEEKIDSVFGREALASGSISEALKIMREKGLKGSKQEQVAGRQKDASKGGGYDEDAKEHWADKEFAKKFAGKEGTRKEIVIQRLDEFGRPMTTKEAWRQLNHAFHGKAPGAKAQERRKKQYLEEMAAKKLNAGEHSISQMEKLHKVQEKGGNAHIVLTGSNSVAANAIAAAAHASRKGGGGGGI